MRRSTGSTSRRSFDLETSGLDADRPSHRPLDRAEHRCRVRACGTRGQAHRGESPERRSRLFRPSRAAVHLRDARTSSCSRAERWARRSTRTARSRRASTTSTVDGRRRSQAACRSEASARRCRHGHDVAGPDVPYIVRIETGTINRAIYQIAMLHDPAARTRARLLTRSAGWNGRLILHIRRGLHGRLVQPGRIDRRRRRRCACCSADMRSRRPR